MFKSTIHAYRKEWLILIITIKRKAFEYSLYATYCARDFSPQMDMSGRKRSTKRLSAVPSVIKLRV